MTAYLRVGPGEEALRLPGARGGVRLQVRKRDLHFSFWPVYPGPRFGLNVDLFSKSPWPVMADAIQHRCPPRARKAAKAFLLQAEEFQRAAEDEAIASKPLLFYYSFLNVAKAYILTARMAHNLDVAKHGLEEVLPPGGKEFYDAAVRAYPSRKEAKKKERKNIFDLFGQSLEAPALSALTEYKVQDLLAQIVSGHRLWTAATQHAERFIPIEEVLFMQGRNVKRIWTVITVLRENIDRFGITHKRLLDESRLRATFKEVKPLVGEKLLRFQQVTPIHYSHRPSDVVMDAVKKCRPYLWPVVRSTSPYRRYYLYLDPSSTMPLHPLLSVYALMFYLGSVTRYRPHHFDIIRSSPYNPQISEILATEPRQFLYLMASEFAQTDVNWPAIL